MQVSYTTHPQFTKQLTVNKMLTEMFSKEVPPNISSRSPLLTILRRQSCSRALQDVYSTIIADRLSSFIFQFC